MLLPCLLTGLPGRSIYFLKGSQHDKQLSVYQGSQYDLKDSPGAHPPGLAVHAAQGFYPYSQYQYGDPSRAKTATRETTSTLKAWLQEHQKNPYPTKGEKIRLAIITKMTLTQVACMSFSFVYVPSLFPEGLCNLNESTILAGVHVVRQRAQAAEKGEQGDVGTQRGRQRRTDLQQ